MSRVNVLNSLEHSFENSISDDTKARRGAETKIRIEVCVDVVTAIKGMLIKKIDCHQKVKTSNVSL